MRSRQHPLGSAIRVAVVLGLGMGLVSGFGAGCLIELERGLSCGDGWVDHESGEECDPKDPSGAHLSACRDQGWVVDASCDAQTCQIRASEADCTVCGDGMATGNEACDGADLRGATCPGGGLGEVECTEECTVDLSDCPEVCGDGIVSGTEECDPDNPCNDDGDCDADKVCSFAIGGECVTAGEGLAPKLSCSSYEVLASLEKPSYASGTIERCTSECTFGRDDCGFCGDGILDGKYSDLVWPSATPIEFAAEVCDGEEADEEHLTDYCRSLCIDGPSDPDLSVRCDFECEDDCSGFSLPDDFVPGDFEPADINCCLAAGDSCPKAAEPVPDLPDLPCCYWLENPEDGEVCVWSGLPMREVCPG